MSEWGRVAFQYDYEGVDRRGNPKQVKGLISRTYKYPSIEQMLGHAYFGLKYFKAHFDVPGIDLNLLDDCTDTSGWAALNIAFDVFFEQDLICPGVDSVKRMMEHWRQTNNEFESDDKLKNDLYNCEGTMGWILISFTGNSRDGYQIKYGYYLHGEVAGFRKVYNSYQQRNVEYYGKEDNGEKKIPLPDDLEKIISYFEDNTSEVASEEEFWGMEELGVTIMREWIEKSK